ncbi:hypothetical protein C7212DRAFT_346561 [Tuber magnatum]|uniref:Uncharacterized protein n=1 Tax=Tuber magnatum TaxID=42249 RepID=A0A317SJS0_9PEZI|nr:hypothetical protein C7212DRAFT_346561 [Tuber magnatum]
MAFAKATNASFGIMGLGKGSGQLDRLKKEGKIGGLVVGGYDFAKQKGDGYVPGPLVGGIPKIQLTGVNMHGPEATQLLGEKDDDALDAEIDYSYEDYGGVGSPKPSSKTFMPIMKYTGSTAIFGRAFLKAAYLAVNYETDEFQVAPASYRTLPRKTSKFLLAPATAPSHG